MAGQYGRAQYVLMRRIRLKTSRNGQMRSGLFFFVGGGCRHIKTGGRCRLKLRHSRHFSSFPRKRESRTSNFQIMADSHLKCNF
ncbi:hypothetical protein GC082_11610 [Neisseria meningitidis]|nr:hypothetical protein [Neisseria meningitidis]